MRDPYVYEGTNVLINLANIKDQRQLDNYELALANLAIADMLNNPINIQSTEDIFLIHQKLFKDVYSWAGQPRTINIFKTEAVLDGLSVTYSDFNSIKKDLAKIQREIDVFDWENSSKKEIVKKITVVIAKVWQVHAFREGNTRTICLFLYFFMKNHGLKVNVDYEHLEAILMGSTYVKTNIGDETKYQTIRGYALDKYEYNYHHVKDR